ncbi:MAG: hypothetical protein IPN67_05980 [Bacteroidales bacterium]|nr:hypothetical protein [Bacteroidales bacterium]
MTEPVYNVRDLWEKKNLGASKEGLKFAVNSHGARLFRISKAQ